MKRFEPNPDYLADYGPVSRWAVKNYNLQRADLELLFHLNANSPFTMEDFCSENNKYSQKPKLRYSKDPKRFRRLRKDDWLTNYNELTDINRSAGECLLYTVTSKTRRMVNRIDKMLQGEEEIPDTFIKNNLKSKASYSNYILADSLKKHKETKAKKRRMRRKYERKWGGN